MSRLAQELSGIFKTAGEAHGFAFVQVDGEDDDWAYWYAGILQQPLSQALGRHLTRAQIVVCLMTVEDERLTRIRFRSPLAGNVRRSFHHGVCADRRTIRHRFVALLLS